MTWDWWLYFPSEGRCAEEFFALKNPMALAGFEPANLGTKGQHATPRPLKPLSVYIAMKKTGVCFSLLVEVTERILFESKLRLVPLNKIWKKIYANWVRKGILIFKDDYQNLSS